MLVKLSLVHVVTVSSLNATDNTLMYEMPLIHVFGLWRPFLYRGFGQWHFVIGVLSRDRLGTWELKQTIDFALS